MNRVLLLLGVIIILASCNSDQRESWVGGDNDEFIVYYFDQTEANTAKKVAFFWKENELLTGKKQHLQIRKDKGRFTLSLIAAKPKEIAQMPIDEVQLLAQLKKKLYVEVFNEESFTLEICNDRFEAIYTVE